MVRPPTPVPSQPKVTKRRPSWRLTQPPRVYSPRFKRRLIGLIRPRTPTMWSLSGPRRAFWTSNRHHSISYLREMRLRVLMRGGLWPLYIRASAGASTRYRISLTWQDWLHLTTMKGTKRLLMRIRWSSGGLMGHSLTGSTIWIRRSLYQCLSRKDHWQLCMLGLLVWKSEIYK